jgi:hypothetical protein
MGSLSIWHWMADDEGQTKSGPVIVKVVWPNVN